MSWRLRRWTAVSFIFRGGRIDLTEEFFAGLGGRSEEEPPRTIFAVGDYKQSIYGFQGADRSSRWIKFKARRYLFL